MKRFAALLLFSLMFVASCQPTPADERQTDDGRLSVRCAFGDQAACARIGVQR